MRAELVSSADAVAVTVTDSVTPRGRISKSSESSCAAWSFMSVYSVGAKSALTTVTVYTAGFRPVTTKYPSSLLRTARLYPVPWFTTVTVAPRTSAPL